MQLYYRQVTFLPSYKNNEFLVGRCLKILHGVCTRHQNKGIKTINTVGVSFPKWSEQTIGEKISFISPSPLDVDFLLQQRYFTEMESLGYFHLSEISEVPDGCEYAIYRRNQKIDQSTPNGLKQRAKRFAKRASQRGEPLAKFIPIDYTFEHYHSIPISSSSAGDSFRLNLQCQKINSDVKGKQTYSSYGLASQELKSLPIPII